MIGGLVLFDRQKRADRLAELHTEKRLAYATFLEKANAFVFAVGKSKSQLIPEIETKDIFGAYAMVALYAPDELAELAKEMTDFLSTSTSRFNEQDMAKTGVPRLSLEDLARDMYRDLGEDPKRTQK